MIARAYTRCNGGHYFSGACCPIDGWSCQASRELDEASRRLAASGRPLSLASLLEAGVSRESVGRIVVIEFGSADSAFDALSPQGYVVGGKWLPIEDVDDSLM